MFWTRRKRNGAAAAGRSAWLGLEQLGSTWGASPSPQRARPPLQAEVLEVRMTPVRYSTNTTLVSAPNPSEVGEVVTLTSSTLALDAFKGGEFAVPSGGDVTFYRDTETGSVILGRSTTAVGGQATLEVTTLPLGDNMLRAVFAGMTVYNPFAFDPYEMYDSSEGFASHTVEASNTPPTISDIPTQSVTAGVTVGPVAFTVGDAETPADALVVTAVASDTKLAPTVTVGGTGASRTVTVTTAAGVAGTTTVTVTVSDGTATATDTFDVTLSVLPPPPPPPPPPPLNPPPPPPPPAPFVETKRPRLYASGTDQGVPAEARLFNGDGTMRLMVAPYGVGFTGGVRTAVGDVNGDGTPDLITAPGPGTAPTVQVFSGTDGSRIGSFNAFEETFLGGVYVATADFNYDGTDEIVVSPDESGGPRVRVLRGVNGSSVVADFFGIEDPNFRGGVRVAAGDTNGDLVPDLVVAAGFGGGPRIAVFNGASALTSPGAPGRLVGDFFAFEPSLRNGAYVAAGDLSGDGRADLVFGGGPGGGPRVLALDGWGLVRSNGAERRELVNTFAFDPAQRGGVRVSASDYNGDGRVDLLAAPGPGGGAAARGFAGPSFSNSTDIGGVGGSGVFIGSEPTPPGALYQFGDEPGALTQAVLEAARDNVLSSIYDLEYLAEYEGEAFDDDAFLDDAYEQLDQIEEEISRLEQPPPAAEDVPLEPGDFGPDGRPTFPSYSVPDRIASDGILAQGLDDAARLESAMAQVLDFYNRAGARAFEDAGRWVSRATGRPEPAIVGMGVATAIRQGTSNILRQNLPADQLRRIWPEGSPPQALQPNANAPRSQSNPLHRVWRGSKTIYPNIQRNFQLSITPTGATLQISGTPSGQYYTGSGTASGDSRVAYGQWTTTSNRSNSMVFYYSLNADGTLGCNIDGIEVTLR